MLKGTFVFISERYRGLNGQCIRHSTANDDFGARVPRCGSFDDKKMMKQQLQTNDTYNTCKVHCVDNLLVG